MQVDEIMLTLKKAFSKAVEWKKSRTQRQQCDTCPLLQFHALCEQIEGGKMFLLCVILEKTQISHQFLWDHLQTKNNLILLYVLLLILHLASRGQYFPSTDVHSCVLFFLTVSTQLKLTCTL